MIAVPSPKRMTVEAYLAREPLQELRYEFVDGEVVAMAGGTLPHNDIAVNLRCFLPGQSRETEAINSKSFGRYLVWKSTC